MLRIKSLKKIIFLVLLLTSTLIINAGAQKRKKKNKTENKTEKADEIKRDDEIKPYNKIITKEAKSDSGLFVIHQVKNNYYFEIPDSLLSREMLIVSRRAAMSSGESENMVAGERPTNGLMVSWEKSPDGDHILLRKVTSKNSLQYKGVDISFQKAVALQTLDPILISFPIKTIGKDSASYVIDIADLFDKDIKELTPFASKDIFVLLGLRAPIKYKFNEDRSFIMETKSFEKNIEIRSLLTYTKIDKEGTNVFTILMHRSMVLLPKKAMRPRFADARIGHFTQAFDEYNEEKPVETNYYIKRWRLEPKEEDITKFIKGELVEPKQKIVFYIDKNTPMKLRKYIKQGVRDWIPAFENAGFKNAIEAKDAPIDDPDFHPEDVRYSVIRYVASDIPNAKGPSVVDPRSGEILESDVIIYHNVLKLIKEWRFAQTAANDSTVRTNKMADYIIGDGLRYVVAHEIGHSLGLRHNMGASAAFVVDSLRSPTFTKKYGTTPSIMDYARFNYVAQPEDTGVTLSPPSLGIYDKYAIKWGYEPILNAQDEYDEVATLNKWIEAHEDDPRYYFGEGDLVSSDPTSLRESLGDDVVKASSYGVNNIKYIIRHIDEWLKSPGKNYEDMEEYYSAVLKQYNRYLTHVGTVIGGTYLRRPVQGQDELAYSYIEKEKQKEAVQFLLKQYREIPTWIENEELKGKLNIVVKNGVIRKIVTPSTYIETLYYTSFRRHLVNDGKLWSMIDDELSNGSAAYKITDLFTDIRADVFKETFHGEKLDYYRQLMQNVYVSWLVSRSHFKEIVSFEPKAFNYEPFYDLNFEDHSSFCSSDLIGYMPKALINQNKLKGFKDHYALEHNIHYQYLYSTMGMKRDKISTMVLAEVKKVKNILLKYKNTSDGQTRDHYEYLIEKINLYIERK